MAKANRYSQIIEAIFINSYKKGIKEISFSRDEIISTAASLKIALPKNIKPRFKSSGWRQRNFCQGCCP